LNAYSDEFLLINESQVGFRHGYSTNDNIFSLYSLFELLTLKKKKMFIDFEKAFDTVWREGLWCKLLMNDINGKMHNVLVNMYHNVKSRIMYDNEFSEFFVVNENQVSLKHGYSTNDDTFSLYSLFELLTLKNKNVLCIHRF